MRPRSKMNQCLLEQGEVDKILAEAEDTIAKLGGSVRSISSIGADLLPDILEMVTARAQQWEKTGRAVMGIESGFRALDEILNGLGPGLHLLAGAPGVGKTTFALQMSISACLRGIPVIYVTYENSARNLLLKAICARAGLVPRDFERGMAHAEQLQQIKATAKELRPSLVFLEIIEGSMSLQLSEVRGRIRKALQRHNAHSCLVIYDYLQRAAPAEGQKEVRTNVSSLAGHLRDLANRLDCPVLAICSQNRAEGNYGTNRGGSASLTSLKESGDLEYSADSVMFLIRNEQRMATHPAIAVDLTLSKNRFGPVGSIPLIFRPDVGVFREEAR